MLYIVLRMSSYKDKSSHWSITINNPTDEDMRQWNGLKGLHWVKEVMGQIEKGENGTEHIQGYVKTDRVRFTQIKDALPRAHIEIAKNVVALKKYVQKEETRVAAIPTTKVATAADVQNQILDLVEAHGKYKYGELFTVEQMYMYRLDKQLAEEWEMWVDQAVKKLILQGYYGVEFVMANPQVRAAFRKYLPEIIFRQWKSRQLPKEIKVVESIEDECPPSPRSQAPPPPP